MNHLRFLRLMLIAVFSVSSIVASAQGVLVSGTVTDKSNGQPIEGVSVRVKNSNTGTTTGADGKYSLRAPSSESVITFTSVGFAYAELKAGAGSISISLDKVDQQLDDVVVVGYGTKKKVNVLGSVASIKAEQIEDLPVANLGSALINRLPGVGVSFTSGKPGSTTNINIRNSITFPGAPAGVTAEPLYVIDNIIVTREDFENLDASLIEDLHFLKDASAAIYGAAGAKGVILITTKKGKPGKPRISYSGYYGSSTEAVKPKIMSAYEHAKMLNDGYAMTGAPMTQRFSQADLDFLKTNPYASWYDELWKPANTMRHTINVSGGSDRITFFAGGNVYKEGGNYGDIDVNKYGFRSGMNAKIIDGLSANVVFASDFNNESRNTLKGANDETDDLSIRAIYLTPKWVPMSINGTPVGWSGVNPPGNWNPVALFNSGNYKWGKSQGLSVNASLEFKPVRVLKGLTARVQFGKLNRNANAKEYFPPYRVGNFIRGGQNGLLFTNNLNASTPLSNVSNSDQLGESTTLSGSYQLIGTLGYAKQFRNSDFDIMVGFDQGESESENVFFYKNGQLVNGIDEFWAFSNTGQTIRNPQYTQSVKRSFLGRMNYTVMDRYMLEVIARYDASSNFPPETRWGLFPSVGLGWKISEEKFFRGAFPFINSMKIRSNFGLVGEDRVANRLWQSRFTSTTGMLFGTVVTNGLDPNVYPNPDITWEKSRTWNAGFDVTFLRGRMNFTYDYYNRYTYDGFDKLENGVLPPTAGINTAVVNYGQQISWGHEFTLGYRGSIAKDWGFNADVNWGFSNSQMLQSYYNGAFLGQYGTNQLGIMLGRDPRKYNSSNFGYIAKGILRTEADVDRVLAKNPNYLIGGQKPQVGFMDFEDINGDGKIDDNDITTMFDRTTPLVGFGMTFGVNYKSFKLQMNMNMRLGGKSFYDSEARKVPTTTQNAPSFWADSWTPENSGAQFPRADAPLARENSTFWAVSGTQSRINNMVLSYSIPKKLAERYKIPEFRAFLTGTNLWNLINPLKYKDPYTSNFASYPTLRTISVGLNVTL